MKLIIFALSLLAALVTFAPASVVNLAPRQAYDLPTDPTVQACAESTACQTAANIWSESTDNILVPSYASRLALCQYSEPAWTNNVQTCLACLENGNTLITSVVLARINYYCSGPTSDPENDLYHLTQYLFDFVIDE